MSRNSLKIARILEYYTFFPLQRAIKEARHKRVLQEDKSGWHVNEKMTRFPEMVSDPTSFRFPRSKSRKCALMNSFWITRRFWETNLDSLGKKRFDKMATRFATKT